jgi:tellurite methyltransferase
MSDPHVTDPPSPFIASWIGRLAGEDGPSRRALDVAMGRGRHALVLAAAGFRTFGVDLSEPAVVEARARARARGLALNAWCADLTRPTLPASFFDVIVVARYLQRDLSRALAEALAPGGVLLYETFTRRQLERGRGPRSPDHLLEPGELPCLFPDLEELFYEEPGDPAADALARLAARRRSSPS